MIQDFSNQLLSSIEHIWCPMSACRQEEDRERFAALDTRLRRWVREVQVTRTAFRAAQTTPADGPSHQDHNHSPRITMRRLKQLTRQIEAGCQTSRDMLRSMLESAPMTWTSLVEESRQLEGRLVEAVVYGHQQKVHRVKAEVERWRRNYGYHGAGPLLRMAISELDLCSLHLQYVTTLCAFHQRNKRDGAYWERRFVKVQCLLSSAVHKYEQEIALENK